MTQKRKITKENTIVRFLFCFFSSYFLLLFLFSFYVLFLILFSFRTSQVLSLHFRLFMFFVILSFPFPYFLSLLLFLPLLLLLTFHLIYSFYNHADIRIYTHVVETSPRNESEMIQKKISVPRLINYSSIFLKLMRKATNNLVRIEGFWIKS